MCEKEMDHRFHLTHTHTQVYIKLFRLPSELEREEMKRVLKKKEFYNHLVPVMV